MFKKILALLLALILALPAGALAEAAPAGNAAAAQGAEEAVEASLEAMEGALEEAQPELLLEGEPEPSPEGEIEPTPEPDSRPEAPRETDEAEAEIQPEASLRVRVEADELLMLHALVDGDMPVGFTCQWQAAERAVLLEARQTGADEEPLWSDIEGAQGEVLDVQAAFREAFADYSYRCLVRAGESSAASEPYSFQAERVEASEEAEPGEESESGEEAEEAVEAHPLFASEAAELRFAESPVKIGKGERYTPALVGLPEGAEGVSYKSSKPKIFSVNPDTGEIEGLKTGKGKLTVTYGPSSASVTVQVCAAPKSFRIDPAELELGVGELAAPGIVPSPKNSFGHVQLWYSKNKDAVAVEDGKLRAVAPGEATITAVLFNNLYSECKVTVREAPVAGGMALTLPEGSEDGVIGVGQTVQLGVRYENAAGSVEFRSESEAVAAVDAGGQLKGVAPGKAVIVARAYNGAKASLEITVKAKPTKLALENAPKYLGVGEPWTLRVKLSNKAGDDCGGAVTFKSSKSSVLDVDPHTGALTAKKTGKAKITATTYNKLKKSATITVKQAPTGFTLSASELEIGMGQSGAKLTVAYAGKKQFGNVRWENENPDVVTLSAKGALTPLAPGSSRITATVYNPASPDEPFVQICDVTVKQKPEKGGVRLVFLDSEGKERSTIGVGESVSPSIVCANGGGGGFTLSSSKKSVATTSKSGVVKGKKKGKAKITAKTYNNVKASVTMQVVPAPALVRYTYYPGNPMPKGTRYKLRVMMVDKDYKETELMTHTFESSNPDIVSVDPVTGVLTAVSDRGNAKITARAYNGVEAVIYVFATKAPDEGEGSGSTSNPTIRMTQSKLTLKPGETAELDVKTTGMSYLTGADVYWASDESSVATVSWGHVKAVGPGTTRVTASVEGPSGPLTAECQVTVTNGSAPSPGEDTPKPGEDTPKPGENTPEPGGNTPNPGGEDQPSISLNYSTLDIKKGDAWMITATLNNLPGKTKDDVAWSSSNDTVATVKGGLVTGRFTGTATITATIEGPSGPLTAQCQVSVTNKGSDTPVGEDDPQIYLDQTWVDMEIGDEVLLHAGFRNMPDADPANIKWTSDGVISVDSGRVTAKRLGVGTVTASITYKNTKYIANCDFVVNGEMPDPELRLNVTQLSLVVGERYTSLRATMQWMHNSSSVTWQSGDESVVTVDSYGWLKAIGPGSTIVTASVVDTLDDGSTQTYTAECAVLVEEEHEEVRVELLLSYDELRLYVGESVPFGAQLIGMPDLGPEDVHWENSAPEVASFEDGAVRARSAGETILTASVTDPLSGQLLTSQCKVCVEEVSLAIRQGALNLAPGESASLELDLTGASAEDVRWESSNEQVASVSGGTVTARGVGRATITARVAGRMGEISDTCVVRVTRNWREPPVVESVENTMDGRVRLDVADTGAKIYRVYEIVDGLEVPRGDFNRDVMMLYGVKAGTHTYIVRARTLLEGESSSPIATVSMADSAWVEGESSEPVTIEVPKWRAPISISSTLQPSLGTVEFHWSYNSSKKSVRRNVYELLDDDTLVPLKTSRETVYNSTVEVTVANQSAGWHCYVVSETNNGVECNLSHPVNVRVNSLAMNESGTTVFLDQGEQHQYTVETNMPAGYSRELRWFSSDETVATVDQNGLVTALHTGEATICVESEDGCGAKATVSVNPKREKLGDFTVVDGVATYYSGEGGDVVVPEGVVEIEASLFWKDRNITSLTLPSGFKTIGQRAFYMCTSLESVSIPGSLINIGTEAFYGCSYLTSVTYAPGEGSADGGEIPEGATGIGDRAFQDCARLTSVDIPYGVTRVGDYAFYRCTALQSVYIPDSVTYVGDRSFAACSSMTSARLSENLTSITQFAFCDCNNLLSVNLPKGLTSIGRGAFGMCKKLEIAELPSTLVSIGDLAFQSCGMVSITRLPEGLTYLGSFAFDGCAISSINIPEGLDEIPGNAFCNCDQLGNVTIPSNIKRIGSFAFAGCDSFTSITVPDTVIEIDEGAFGDCKNLTSIKLPSTLPYIGASMFYSCEALEYVQIPRGVTYIGEEAFKECKKLNNITIPSSVTHIDARAFYDCDALTSIVIPEGVTALGDWALSECWNLRSITLPASLTSIGDRAFYVTRYDGSTYERPQFYCPAGSWVDDWLGDSPNKHTTTSSSWSGTLTLGTGMTADGTTLLGNLETCLGYHSSSPEIADFDADGVLTALLPGRTTINDLANRLRYDVTVVGFEEPEPQIVEGETQRFEPVDIEGAWSSSSSEIASVDEDGNVTAHSPGTATIKIAKDDNLWASYNLTVVSMADAVTLDRDWLILGIGETLPVAFMPPESGAIPASATLASDNGSIASVSGMNVTGVAPGRCNLVLNLPGKYRSNACSVLVLREGDSETAQKMLDSIDNAYNLLEMGHNAITGVQAGPGTTVAEWCYRFLDGKVSTTDIAGLTDVIYMTEKIMDQHANLDASTSNTWRTVSEDLCTMLNITKPVQEALEKYLSLDDVSLQGIDLEDVEAFEKWFDKNAKSEYLEKLGDGKKMVKGINYAYMIVDAVVKSITFASVNRADVMPIANEMKRSGDEKMKLAGWMIDYLTESHKNVANYVASITGVKIAEKEIISLAKKAGWAALKAIPPVAMFMAGAEIGTAIGYPVSNALFNADGISTAEYDLLKAHNAAESYMEHFDNAYKAFAANPVSQRNGEELEKAARVFASLVSAEYDEFERKVSKVSDAFISTVQSIWSKMPEKEKQFAKEMKDLGKFYLDHLPGCYSDFAVLCDGENA